MLRLICPNNEEGASLPPEMKFEYGNYLEMSDDQLRGYFRGCDGFVFAAGVDERLRVHTRSTSFTGSTTSTL